jgi:RNA polymerase sigma factor for flagellar operon FliA
MVTSYVRARPRRKRQPGADDRSNLVQRFLPLVGRVVNDCLSGKPAHLDRDDLFSAGVFGLLRGIERFDVRKGSALPTYLARRIRGSILDEMRARAPVPRLARQAWARRDRASAGLVQTLGREPSDAELAESLGLTLDAYHRRFGTGGRLRKVTTNGSAGGDGDVERISSEDLGHKRGGDPFQRLLLRDMFERISRILSPQERWIVILRYFDELGLQDIGRILGLPAARVCRIHQEALGRLRTRFSRLLTEYLE